MSEGSNREEIVIFQKKYQAYARNIILPNFDDYEFYSAHGDSQNGMYSALLQQSDSLYLILFD